MAAEPPEKQAKDSAVRVAVVFFMFGWLFRGLTDNTAETFSEPPPSSAPSATPSWRATQTVEARRSLRRPTAENGAARP